GDSPGRAGARPPTEPVRPPTRRPGRRRRARRPCRGSSRLRIEYGASFRTPESRGGFGADATATPLAQKGNTARGSVSATPYSLPAAGRRPNMSRVLVEHLSVKNSLLAGNEGRDLVPKARSGARIRTGHAVGADDLVRRLVDAREARGESRRRRRAARLRVECGHEADRRARRDEGAAADHVVVDDARVPRREDGIRLSGPEHDRAYESARGQHERARLLGVAVPGARRGHATANRADPAQRRQSAFRAARNEARP